MRHKRLIDTGSSSSFQTAIKISDKMNLEISKKKTSLDQLLIEIIDPKMRAFSDKELIENYDFPLDDPEKVDLDNI